MAVSQAGTAIAIKNILVATDFSSSSQTGLEYAAILARQQHGKILLAHVLYAGPVVPFEEAPPAGFPDVSSARLAMETLLAAPQFAGIEHELLFPHGEICGALEEIVGERRVDFVVTGTRGREGVMKLLVGSVAEKVLRCAPCPVLIVGPRVAAGPQKPARLRHILVATDFTPACERAISLARQLAQAEGASLAVMHVRGGEAAHGGPEEAMAKLRAAAPDGVETIVEAGDAAECIVRVARQQQASLVIMGLHRRSPFLAAHFSSTTAHQVITQAPCPVLTVGGAQQS